METRKEIWPLLSLGNILLLTSIYSTIILGDINASVEQELINSGEKWIEKYLVSEEMTA